MHSAILERKKEIIGILDKIKKYPIRNEFRHEMMTYAYVLTNGAIEFMVETLLRDWIEKTIDIHSCARRYGGKIKVASYLNISSQISKTNISSFHSASYERIVSLIDETAGKTVRSRFKELVKQSKAIEPDLDAKLKRINDFRGRLVHGESLPIAEQPNIDELKEDFVCVYKHIIKNLDTVLRKTKS
jgi:uncharacterized protein YutE (UPF0331/DUF86 family)